MLDSLRKQTGSWIVKAFLGVLILSFAVWGIGDIFRGPSDATVATVGDVEITRSEFGDAYRRELDRLNRRMGQQLDADQARRLGIENLTLQRMINRALFDQVALGYGLTVSDKDLAADIRSNPAFRNDLGRFDPLYYRDMLRQLGYTREYFEYVRRADLRRTQLMNGIALGAETPRPVVDAIFRHRAERRVADVAVVLNSSIPTPATPDDAVLEQFYKDSSGRYMAPEYRALTYVALTPEQLLDEVTVTETEISDEYESRLDEFIEPERRDLSQIVVDDETSARDALEKLKQGEAFEDIARDTAGLEPEDTALGVLTIAELPLSSNAAETVFAAPQGQYLDPQRSDFGWHIYRINEVIPGRTTSLEEAREDLRGDLALRRAADSLFELANELEDELAGGATLEESANRLNLNVGKLSRIDAGGRAPDGAEVENVPAYPEFLPTAFGTAEGQESALTESIGGGYFIVRVDGITPTSSRPLDSIREQVITDWNESERVRLTRERATAIADRIRQGESLESLAAAEGLDVRSTQALTRYDAGVNRDVSGELLSRLFALTHAGDVAEGSTPQGTGHMIAVLRRIDRAGSEADEQPEHRELWRNLDEALADDILAQYRVALNREYDIEVNQRAIDSLF